MQTVFDLVQADYIIHAMVFNIVSLGSVAISNILDNTNETVARVISLSVFSFIMSSMIHFIALCLTRLASIYLLGIIEDVNGETIKLLTLHNCKLFGNNSKIIYCFIFSDKLLLNGIRLFVLIGTFFFVLIEIIWNGVGATQLHNSLTGIPLKITNKKGFSGVMLNVVYITVLIVAIFTQLLVFFERRKIKYDPFNLTNNQKVIN